MKNSKDRPPKSVQIRTLQAITKIDAPPHVKLYLYTIAARLNETQKDFYVWGGLRGIANAMGGGKSSAARAKAKAIDQGYIVQCDGTHERQRDRRKKGGRSSDLILIDISRLEQDDGYEEPRDDLAKWVRREAEAWREYVKKYGTSSQRRREDRAYLVNLGQRLGKDVDYKRLSRPDLDNLIADLAESTEEPTRWGSERHIEEVHLYHAAQRHRMDLLRRDRRRARQARFERNLKRAREMDDA